MKATNVFLAGLLWLILCSEEFRSNVILICSPICVQYGTRLKRNKVKRYVCKKPSMHLRVKKSFCFNPPFGNTKKLQNHLHACRDSSMQNCLSLP